jgi:zinc transporter ZupT
VFTSTSPVLAIVAHTALEIFDKKASEAKIVGMLLFVSAGTFIYVSLMHILPEVLESISRFNNLHSKKQRISKGMQVLLLVLG